jgi:hypothetical protein
MFDDDDDDDGGGGGGKEYVVRTGIHSLNMCSLQIFNSEYSSSNFLRKNVIEVNVSYLFVVY